MFTADFKRKKNTSKNKYGSDSLDYKKFNEDKNLNLNQSVEEVIETNINFSKKSLQETHLPKNKSQVDYAKNKHAKDSFNKPLFIQDLDKQ